VALEGEAALHEVAPVDADGAAAELPAVEGEVVLHRPGPAGRIRVRRPVRVAGGGHQERLIVGQDAGERVVGGVPAVALLVPLVHREAVDPAVGEDVGVGKAEAGAQLRAQAAEDVGDDRRPVGDDEEEVALLRPGQRRHRPGPLLAHELHRRAVDAVACQRQVDEAPGAEALRRLRQLVDLASARAGEAGRDDALHPPTGGKRLVEDPEAGGRAPGLVAEGRGEVDQLHPEAQVGLVGAEALERLVVGEPRERDVLERPLGVTARETAIAIVSTKSITVSSATKLISRSSWVNSGWRSPRRSSSRKQRAIWK